MIQTPPFPDKQYQIIYADPPWRLPACAFSRGERLEDKYDTMSMTDIHALPVETIAKDDAFLYLWVVDSFLPECLKTIDAWGFEYRKSFIWDKLQIGLGMYNRGQHEQLCMAKRGCPEMPELSDLAPSILSVKRGSHSSKPKQFRHMIDKYHPADTKIELFARPNWTDYNRGWDFWGNEVEIGSLGTHT